MLVTSSNQIQNINKKLLVKYTGVIFTLIALCTFIFPLKSQTFLGHSIHFTPKDNPQRAYDEKEYKEQLKEKYDSICQNKVLLDEFILELTDDKKYFLQSNYEYEKLDSLNAYLQKIADLINKTGNTTIKVKICRDPSVNASAYEDGTIYVNIGLLALFETEAQIAALLGHEITHVTSYHSFKHYTEEKRYMSKVVTNYYWGRGGYIDAYIQNRNFSKKLMAFEEESDAGALAMLSASNYSNDALRQMFVHFDELEKKSTARYGLQGGSYFNYIKTHPPTSDRLKKATEIGEKKGGRNFIIDSIMFGRLKQIATDETINLFFEKMELDECLELAFASHLRKPNDPFYLFYMTECTRRIIATEPLRANEMFITGSFKNKYDYGFPESKFNHGGIAFTNNKYIKQQSIHVLSVFYTLNKNEKQHMSSDTSCALLRNDTLEFVTNADALEYFKNLNAKFSYKLNNLFVLPKESPITSTATDKFDLATAFREDFYNNLPAAVNSYHSKKYEKQNVLLVIYDINYLNINQQNFKVAATKRNDKYADILDYLKKYGYTSDFSLPEELHFNERNRVVSFLKIVSQYFSKRSYLISSGIRKSRGKVNFDLEKSMPELSALLLNHGYTGIVFSSINIKEENRTQFIATAQQDTWEVKNYYLDVKNGKINYYATAFFKIESDLMGTMIGGLGVFDVNDEFVKSVQAAVDGK